MYIYMYIFFHGQRQALQLVIHILSSFILFFFSSASLFLFLVFVNLTICYPLDSKEYLSSMVKKEYSPSYPLSQLTPPLRI